MHNLVYHNQRVLPVAEARLSPGQTGLFSGHGLFTTIRIYDGRPFAFERHWERLCRDAGRIGIPLDFSSEAVAAALRGVIAGNRVKEGYVRIYFVRNKGGAWSSEEAFPPTDLVIISSDLPSHPSSTRLSVQAQGRHAAHPLAGTKVTSWLSNVWSLEEANRRGFDEVILLNERGEVAECTAANVFCVRKGNLETPPLSSGCLAGVTREVLLGIGPGLNLPVREVSLSLQQLYEAEEVFITSTTREVLPVSQIEECFWPQTPGPVTARLAKAFSDFVAQSFSQSVPGARS